MGLHQRISTSSPILSNPIKPQAVKYRKIKILLFSILFIASTIALVGALKKETTYIDTGLFFDNRDSHDGGKTSERLNGNSQFMNEHKGNVAEERLTFVPGEEWAGSISATHAPEQGTPVVEEKTQDVPVPIPEEKEKGVVNEKESEKEDEKVDNHSEDAHNENEDDEDEEYVRDGMASAEETDLEYDYAANPDGSDDDVDEEYSYDPKDVTTSEKEEETRDEETVQGLEYLKSCRTLECIKKAHKKLQGKTKFNAPHFFLIGFQKCATTSVNHYLRGHPEYLPSVLKEAHYFTACRKSWNDTNCKAKDTEDYIDNYLRIKDVAENGLVTATVDASVDYAWKGEELARDIHKMFPWLKIVVMLREPISRVISYTRMWTQKGVRTSTHKDNRIACDSGEELFDCLYPHLTPKAYTGHYAVPLEGWLKVWPANQIHVIQFEEFVSNTDAVMRRLKKFLGMDPTLPEDVQLYNVNTRKDSGHSPMKRRQYRTLVEMARPDSEKVANLLHTYGLANRKEWMGRWQGVWDGVLNSCNASRICMVNSN